MRIGFDVSQTGEGKAGCGYFADSLIRNLTRKDRHNKYLLYPHFGNTFGDHGTIKKTAIIDFPNVSRVMTGKNFCDSISFWEKFPPHGEDVLGNPDIVHANNYYCPQGFQKARIVYTLYDMSFVVYPEFTTESNRLICFDGVLNASCYADYIVAISDYSRNSFLQYFPHYPSDRICVVHLGSRFSETPEDFSIEAVNGLTPHEFWLTVGTLEPRKNLRRLLRAYTILVKKKVNIFPLVLAGGKGWHEDGLEELIRQLDIEKHVKIIGYVKDEQLAWLYQNCFSFIYPSIYEGFGLPVLEALSYGAAVITSNTTSLPEVAGDAAVYINPLIEEDITEAMFNIMNDNNNRMHLKKISKQQAKKFSWDKCASEILGVYEMVMKHPKLYGLYNE